MVGLKMHVILIIHINNLHAHTHYIVVGKLIYHPRNIVAGSTLPDFDASK